MTDIQAGSRDKPLENSDMGLWRKEEKLPYNTMKLLKILIL